MRSTRKAIWKQPSAIRSIWRLCKTYFGCGTPLASEAGTNGLLEGNVDKAKALLKEAGYDGRPIVLLQVSDLASLANLGPVAKAQLERVGFKVDMRPADWQTHLSRVMRKEPPEDRGWNVTLSSTGVLDVVNPVTSLFLNSACDKASAGWSCDAKIEELRNAFALEPDAAKRKAIAEQIQAARHGTRHALPAGGMVQRLGRQLAHQGLASPAFDHRLLERRSDEALSVSVSGRTESARRSPGFRLVDRRAAAAAAERAAGVPALPGRGTRRRRRARAGRQARGHRGSW